jgi:hypothetical protein
LPKKFSLTVDCGIFGKFDGIGSLEVDNSIKITLVIPINGTIEELKLTCDVEIMTQEYQMEIIKVA